jgi:hypothetical protein
MQRDTEVKMANLGRNTTEVKHLGNARAELI